MATNEKIHIKTTINGNPEEFLADPHTSLLDALREIVGLTGSKEGCLDGNCGACTVSVNGRIVDSCLVLAAEVDGQNVDTVEGMANSDGLPWISMWYLYTRFFGFR